MEVVVNLDRAQLALVNNIGRAQRTNVEPVRQTNAVRCMLAQNIQLPSKVLVVERAAVHFTLLRCPSIVVTHHDKRLHRLRLTTMRRRAENRTVDGHFTPAQDTQAQLFGNRFEQLDVLCACLIILRCEEEIAACILAYWRQLKVVVDRHLATKKGIRHTSHNTRTVTVTGICTRGTSVRHVAQQEARF